MKRLIIVVSVLTGAAGMSQAEAPTRVLNVQDLPTVEEVFSNAVKAVGGRTALDQINTLRTTMSMESMGQKMQVDCSWSRAGGRLVKMGTPMGEMLSGTDGTTAWRKTPMGYQVMEDAQSLGMASIHMMTVDPKLLDKSDIKELKVVGKESFDGKDCHKLSYMNKGKPGFAYFDVATGLPVGTSEASSGGDSKSVFGDWKPVNGVKFFHSMKMESAGGGRGKLKDGGMNGEIKVDAIEVNTLEESTFALPEEVKKLGPAKKRDAGSAEDIKLEDLSKDDQREAKQMMESLGQMDVKMLKQMESSMGMGIDYMPEDKKKLMKFYLQEIRKEIAKRG